MEIPVGPKCSVGPRGFKAPYPKCENVKELCHRIRKYCDQAIYECEDSCSEIGIQHLARDLDILISDYYSKPEDFLIRLLREYCELDTKTTKLKEFIHNKRYLELNEENRALLNAQYNAMMAYQLILKRRIEINGGNV